MVVNSGAVRLVFRLSRRSSLHPYALSALYESLIERGYREFGSSTVRNQQWISSLPTSRNYVNQSNCLQFELIKPCYAISRSIHSTVYRGRDYYEALGLSNNAATSDLKKAYYGLAKKLHPDVNKADPEAEKKFQEVQKAYEVLKDEEQRQIYDKVGHDAFERATNGVADTDHSGPLTMEDILWRLYESDNMGGKHVQVPLELSFMEAIQGCTKTVTFQTELTCKACGGSGVPPGTRPETCKRCKGSGVTYKQEGMHKMEFDCIQCGGSGKVVKSLCKSCNGQRVTIGPKSVNLNIIPGIDENDAINVPRSGGADPFGDRPGDLEVIIKIREDPTFRRKGPDIHVDAVLNATQAMLGGTIQVPTLTGSAAVKFRAGTQPNEKVVLKGKGIRTRKSHSFGNQYVHFIVNSPKEAPQEQGGLTDEFSKEGKGEIDECMTAEASG